MRVHVPQRKLVRPEAFAAVISIWQPDCCYYLNRACTCTAAAADIPWRRRRLLVAGRHVYHTSPCHTVCSDLVTAAGAAAAAEAAAGQVVLNRYPAQIMLL